MSDDERPEGLPDRRKHGYRELEQRLDAHVNEIKEHQRKVFLGGLFMIAVIGITTAVSLFLFGIILREQQRQSDELIQQALSIQAQRANSARTICENQNTNNTNAKRYLKANTARALGRATTAQERQEIIVDRNELLDLIDAVVPLQNCDKVVANLATPKEGDP